MDQEILILICATCGACDTAVMAELSKLQKRPGAELVVRLEECLDTCDSEPSVMVDGVSIAPANPAKLRSAVERARNERAKEG